MIGEVVQGASRCEFLTDLRDGRIVGITAGPTVTRKRSVTCIKMNHHVAVVLILTHFEYELPTMR